ncbi:hypothetical protein EV356DRAFT_64656 [Viridothelium virens]|uniref:Rhodopsin domain-containing protein n=1 Tax=Viridothelium virens TaxID=1048519 RepID=A0A6A6HGS9_VIRVR|nr:hypothetical protein EV356DRAFT_64656 [Viridothelium virens]
MIGLTVESWIWYGFVLAVTIARFISRSLALGSFRNLQADDYVVLLALCTYTVLIVTINIVSDDETNLLPPGFDINSLTKDDIRERKIGSKLVLVVEQTQILTVWAVKTCLLIMYYRLTIVRKENVAVVALAIYVAFGFVFMEIFYFGVWCRPFHDYWAVPTPNPQCSAAIHHLITNAVFNISSDVLTLALALQMFIRSKLPLRRKLLLCGIFGLGIFVIFAAVLNKYYSFNQPFGSQWTYWYVRESSTAMIVANLPFLWTLLRRMFKLGSFENPSQQRPVRTSNSAGMGLADGEPHGLLQRLRIRGRRFSSHVLHGVGISSNQSGTLRR